jgi:hypothetical protein
MKTAWKEAGSAFFRTAHSHCVRISHLTLAAASPPRATLIDPAFFGRACPVHRAPRLAVVRFNQRTETGPWPIGSGEVSGASRGKQPVIAGENRLDLLSELSKPFSKKGIGVLAIPMSRWEEVGH